MKPLILVIVFSLFLTAVYCQDTSKVQVIFQTTSNQSAPLYKQVYVGDIHTIGYVGSYPSYENGIVTKNEFLFNAPNSGLFEKNKPVVLVMTDNKTYSEMFTVNPDKNQKWLLTLPGTDYVKAKKEMRSGAIGLFISSLLLTGVIINNVVYNSNMAFYNSSKSMGLATGSKPTQSPGYWYILPAVAFGISLPMFVNGRNLYLLNRPSAKQIE